MSSLPDLPGLLNVKKRETMIHWLFQKKEEEESWEELE